MLEDRASTRPRASTTWATPSSPTSVMVARRSPPWAETTSSRSWARSTRSFVAVIRAWRVSTSAQPPAASVSPVTSTTRAVVRARRVRTSAGFRVEAVAHQPHRLKTGPVEGDVDALTQLPDVDLDDVGVSLIGEVPHVLEDRGLGEHLAGPAHQELQQ